MTTQVGATIDRGPRPWAILQQIDGFASIELGGSWMSDDRGCRAKSTSASLKRIQRTTSYDTATYLPVLGFYRFPIHRKILG